jgi:hypothetical protein
VGKERVPLATRLLSGLAGDLGRWTLRDGLNAELLTKVQSVARGWSVHRCSLASSGPREV